MIFAMYLLAAFPNPPETLNIYPSLASLPLSAKSWQIYPEDFFEGGAYVEFPYGRMRYWLIGPEKGKKVRLAALATANSFNIGLSSISRTRLF
jgi:hypothetical protein